MFHLYFPLKIQGLALHPNPFPTHLTPKAEVKKTLPRFQTRHVYKCLGVTDGVPLGMMDIRKKRRRRKEQKGVPKKR